MFKIILLVAFAFVIVNAQEPQRVAFRPCPGGHPTPDWIEGKTCTAEKCVLTRGTTWLGTTQFQTRGSFSRLTVKLTASYLGIPTNVDIPPGYDNACDFLRAPSTCPIHTGTPHIWDIQSPIDAGFPAINGLDLRIEIFEATNIANCAIVKIDVK